MSALLTTTNHQLNIRSIAPLRDLMVNDNGFAFDPKTGLTYTLSETGREIVAGLIQGLEPELILFEMRSRVHVEEQVLRDDFDAFLRALAQLSLIELEGGE